MTKKTWQVWTEENEGYFNIRFEGSKTNCEKYIRKNKIEHEYHLGYDITPDELTWFDSMGHLIKYIPEQCVNECSQSGDVSEYVKHWTLKLDFSLPSLIMGRKFLSEFGAWEDLETADMFTLSQRVLWLACGDIKENGLGFDEWSLIH